MVWIDEDDHIVRPNSVAFSNDMFKEFTGVESGPHLDASAAWVRDGTVSLSDDDARDAVTDLADDEVRARLHFRVARRGAAPRRRRGRAPPLRRAGELAPMDFTIRRAAMPLSARTPSAPEFMALWQEWHDAGSPFHGLASMTAPDVD